MKVTYETLKDLGPGDLCLIKYLTTAVKPELDKAATLEPFNELNMNQYPIFDETKTKVFFHFISESHSVALNFEKIIEEVWQDEMQFTFEFLTTKNLVTSLFKEKRNYVAQGNCRFKMKTVLIEFQFKDFSIFIDEKTISKIIPTARKKAWKNFYVTFSENDVNITLPHYIIPGEIDKDGYAVSHIMMTSGHARFDSLVSKVKRDLACPINMK